MVLIGFDKVPVQAHAMAENVLKRLDVAIVYDKSGSMNDDTYCFQCYNDRSTRPDYPYRRPLTPGPPTQCYGCYDSSGGPGLSLPGTDVPALSNQFCGAQTPVTRRRR